MHVGEPAGLFWIWQLLQGYLQLLNDIRGAVSACILCRANLLAGRSSSSAETAKPVCLPSVSRNGAVCPIILRHSFSVPGDWYGYPYRDHMSAVQTWGCKAEMC